MVRIAQAIVSALVLSFTATAGTAPAAALEPLILAVHPYLPTTEIITRFTPLAEYLARVVGRPVTVRVGPSTGQHIEAVGRDSVDIAFIGPYATREARQRA